MSAPTTLPELLAAQTKRAQGEAIFLTDNGDVSSTLAYRDILPLATKYSQGLIAAGVAPAGRRVVVTSLDNFRDHVIIFWACCLAGIPVCPLPALHPDPVQSTTLIKHIQNLFNNPIVVASSASIASTFGDIPGLKSVAFEDIKLNVDDYSAFIFPSYRPTPDMPVCYMLTSGSTGNPKGVTLQHSQILSQCNGKSKAHGTTSRSRFFNWIAFDHVSSVIEGHVHALYVGANQWHASPAAIVHQPRRLLEWAGRLKISFTFSPNFLLARLLSDLASEPLDAKLDLSALRTLVSGGEAVPMTTAVAVAELLSAHGAPNNAFKAGFGMSETGAGAIFDLRPISEIAALPSTPQYLPLGKCAEGISMRIVDSDGQTLSSGGIGELQIRGPTVFTGYFRNPEATAAAFTADGWFATGDLATIDASGNLELAGRSKDILNINGVKTATKAVEDFIEKSRIHGVVINSAVVVPLRLPGADTETYAVFYSQHQSSDDATIFRQHIRTTRADIKRTCQRYVMQAPHVVLPLPDSYFAKSTIGKVSRGKLARSYLDGSLAKVEQDLADDSEADAGAPDLDTDTAQVISLAVADVFQLDWSILRRSTNLFELGASSMHLMRFKQVLQERTGIPTLSTMDVLDHPNLGDLVDHITSLLESSTGEHEYKPLICFRSEGSKPPLFMVHPGVGEVMVFINLARELADDRPFYALRARGFEEGEEAFENIAEAVNAYHDAIVDKWPSGPYYLGGYSYGAAIAFEIGKKMQAEGRQVNWLGIMNLPPHIQARMNQMIWSEVLMNLSMFLDLAPNGDIEAVRAKLGQVYPEVLAGDVRPEDPLPVISWLFKQFDKERLAELDLQLGPFARWINVAYEITRAGRKFVPQSKLRDSLVTVFCATPLPSMGTREEYKNRQLSVWRDFTDKLELVDVDGAHYTMIGLDHVESFAGRMRGALKRADENIALLEAQRA